MNQQLIDWLVDQKEIVANYFNNSNICWKKKKKSNILWYQLIKCEDLLISLPSK